MTKTLRLLFILCCLFLQGQLLANTVIVKGTVKDSANNPIANKTVKIYSTDSTAGGCALYHSVITNANGYYIDTFSCTGTIKKLLIIVENCNGNSITHDPAVTSTQVESNFIICVKQTTPPVDTAHCKAVFSYTSTAAGVKFNGTGSSAAGDSIISRTWVFGDSSAPVTGNSKDPLHVYTKPGIYNACLTIKTKKGCESTYCQTVVFTPASDSCRVQVVITPEKLAPKKYRFNSAQSNSLPGDSIVQRTWKFGDGTSLDGNQVSPQKEFKDTGIYNVCVKVRTAKGCEKETCLIVTIRDSVTTPGNCKAAFSYTIKDSAVSFASNGSVGTGAADSIISRIWSFGDSGVNIASLTGNIISPVHAYAKPGTYTVLLTIKTKNGCESKFSATIAIAAPVAQGCKAAFTYTAQGNTAKFTSASSKGINAQDSIISRTWIFGDSTTVLQGNVTDLSHTYSKAGKYIVYLYIKTKSGCESKYTETVVIGSACAVDVVFTADRISLRKIQFNSSYSKAVAGDSIIQRNWKFGDGSSLQGNVISPAKEFVAGNFNTCLEVKTANGCVAQTCKSVVIQDSVNTPQSSVEYVKIISINPNPVTTRMVATVFSRNTNVEAEISFYDIYGTRKMTVKKLLIQGNNQIDLIAQSLQTGAYFLKVSTKNGQDSKAFYKL